MCLQGLKNELNAAQFIVDKCRELPGQVHVLALAPLTNLALAFQLDPQLASNMVRAALPHHARAVADLMHAGLLRLHWGGVKPLADLLSRVLHTSLLDKAFDAACLFAHGWLLCRHLWCFSPPPDLLSSQEAYCAGSAGHPGRGLHCQWQREPCR